jgi:toxin ParE1/3/4
VARFEVLLTEGAERDLRGLHRYIARKDSRSRADRLLDEVLALAERLATLPKRGTTPKELERLGIREYRQVLLGPYRVIYRVIDDRVLIYVIADGRRDMQSLLERRLLGS